MKISEKFDYKDLGQVQYIEVQKGVRILSVSCIWNQIDAKGITLLGKYPRVNKLYDYNENLRTTLMQKIYFLKLEKINPVASIIMFSNMRYALVLQNFLHHGRIIPIKLIPI